MNMTINHADGTSTCIKKHNMVVNGGFDFICDAIGNSTRPANMSKIMVGSGTAATTATTTALGTKIAENTATYSHTAGTKVFTMSTHFAPGKATGAITEAGVFNSSGVMLDRVTFKVANIDADDEITVSFQFSLS